MQQATKLRIGLAIILSVAVIAGYYGCGGSSSSSDSGSSEPLFSTGVLDATFGTAGVITTTIGSGDDEAYAIARQTDGKIIMAGYYDAGAYIEFALARYTITGTLDTTFGAGGITSTDIGPTNDYAYALAIQTDGKILAGGYASNGSNYDFAMARYNSNGALDTGFGGGDGIITSTIGSSNDYISTLVIQADGKILAGGYAYSGSNFDFALARYTTAGALDTGFGGGDGVITTTIGSANDYLTALAVQADGKILAGGYAFIGSNNDFVLARYNDTGVLDSSFGTGGVVSTTIGTNNAENYALALQSDGRIILGGCYYDGVANYFALARYATSGAIDNTFGISGVVTTTIGTNSYINALALQSDGKIVAGGYVTDGGSNYDFALARYTTAGDLDTGFDTDGKLTTPIGSGGDSQCYGVFIQPDNKIILGGFSLDADYNFTLARYWR